MYKDLTLAEAEAEYRTGLREELEAIFDYIMATRDMEFVEDSEKVRRVLNGLDMTTKELEICVGLFKIIGRQDDINQKSR